MTFHTLIRWPVAMETASSSYSKTLRASFVAPWPHTMASEISTVPNLLGCTMVTCGSFPLEWSQFKYIRLGPYLDRHHASIPPLNIGAVKNVGSCWFSVVWPSNFHLYLRYLMRPATFPRGDSSWETWKLRPYSSSCPLRWQPSRHVKPGRSRRLQKLQPSCRRTDRRMSPRTSCRRWHPGRSETCWQKQLGFPQYGVSLWGLDGSPYCLLVVCIAALSLPLK